MTAAPRNIALCVMWRDGTFLVGKGYDRVKQEFFYRPLGGGIEAGENAAEAVVREIGEELHVPVRVVRHLGEIDNHFIYEDKPGWEVVQVFEAEFLPGQVPEVGAVDGESWTTTWVSLDTLDGALYPEGLTQLLTGRASD